jgi:hypothetical protein
MPLDPLVLLDPMPLVSAAIATELDNAAVTATTNSLCFMIIPFRKLERRTSAIMRGKPHAEKRDCR